MRLARLLPLFVVLLLVSCFWAQADDAPPHASEAARAAIAATADVASGCSGDAPGMANPATVYCEELGYEYEIVDTAEGQYGTCAFPGGSKCDGWRFLEGKCGQSYSYCARQGYGLITKSDGKNPFSVEYGVCVDDGQEVGAVSELMGLGEKATRGSRRVEQAAAPPEEGVAAVGQPASFDWRNYDGQDWMTSVKDQASCGGCWAFSAVGTTEAVHNIAASDPTLDLNLSEEYLVSDCYTDWHQSCCGGWQSEALKFIRDDGIPDEACLPWVSGSCPCFPATCNTEFCTYHTGGSCSNATCSDRCPDWASRLETIAAMGRVSTDPSQIKQHVVDRGPLAVCLGVGGGVGGAFDGSNVYRCTDDVTTNHCVVLTGYDDAGGYWIAKNSWGTSWDPINAPGGYFKVGYGECSIENWVYYASLVDQSCTSYTSTDVPKAIPDPGTVTSNLNVSDSFTLADVNVGPLTISHEWDDDLDVFLISPIGTRVELFTDIGEWGDDFIDTAFDDDSFYPIALNDDPVYAPFTWTFSPEGVLADLNGENSAGQWQLEVTDDWADFEGTLESWELELCMSDQDGDGVPDESDNCPETYDTGNGDNDGDGIPGTQPPPGATWGGDACDADDDNDTVLDVDDDDPFDQYVCQDVDADTCDDCSVLGQPDVADDGPDNDSDGLCDAGDDDDDNDVMPDTYEGAHACLDPLLADGMENPDGDELRNYPEMVVATDPCVDNPELADDTDGDGCSDGRESYVGTDPQDDCTDDGTPQARGTHDAWLFDINIDSWSNILDVLLYKGHIQIEYSEPGYDPRLDFNADGWVNVLDVLLYKGNIQIQCTNP